MTPQFFTIGILMLLSAMLPGPDFALVTKNTVLHSRRAGMFTSFGIGCAILVHITYCALGLAFVIYQSLLLFTIIKLIGAAYLFYLGIKLLITKHQKFQNKKNSAINVRSEISAFTAFRQGFLCNLLNPKATLFFLALFTMIIKPGTPYSWEILYAIEMFIIITGWFCSLVLLLSHPLIAYWLDKAILYIEKVLGIFLVGLGLVLTFTKNS